MENFDINQVFVYAMLGFLVVMALVIGGVI
jgi:hypothetical protein